MGGGSVVLAETVAEHSPAGVNDAIQKPFASSSDRPEQPTLIDVELDRNGDAVMVGIFLSSSAASLVCLAVLSGSFLPAWSGSEVAAAGLAFSGGIAVMSASALDV
jgi:hypothetical protein